MKVRPAANATPNRTVRGAGYAFDDETHRVFHLTPHAFRLLSGARDIARKSARIKDAPRLALRPG
jgi:hypothetical protein